MHLAEPDPGFDYTGRALEEELGNGRLTNIHPDDRAMFVQSYKHTALVMSRLNWNIVCVGRTGCMAGSWTAGFRC